MPVTFWNQLAQLHESISSLPQAVAVQDRKAGKRASRSAREKQRGSTRGSKDQRANEDAPSVSVSGETLKPPASLEAVSERIQHQTITSIAEYTVAIEAVCEQARSRDGESRARRLLSAFDNHAKRLIQSASPMLEHLQRRDAGKGVKLESGVRLKHLHSDGPTAKFTLPVLSAAPSNTQAPLLASMLSPFHAVRPKSHVEKNWNHAVPATNLETSPWLSFAPTDDGTQANVGDYEADILLNHRQPWHESPAPAGLSPINFAKGIMRTVSLINGDREELWNEAESAVSALDQDPELKQLLESLTEDEEDGPEMGHGNGGHGQAAVTAAAKPKLRELAHLTDQQLGMIVGLNPKEILRRNRELLARMQALQVERVVAGRPWDVSPRERILATHLRSNLAMLMKQRAPVQVADISAVQSLAGVEVPALPVRREAKRVVDREGEQPAAREEEGETKAQEEGEEGEEGNHEEFEDAGTTHSKRAKRETTSRGAKEEPRQEDKQRAAASDSTPAADTEKLPAPDSFTCEHCGGFGVPWRRPIHHGIPEKLCQACGEYWERLRLPRPAQFHPEDEYPLKLQARPYLFRIK